MGKVVINIERCKGCGLCVEACPKKFLSIGDKRNRNGYYYIQSKGEGECTGCSSCAEMCPDVIIEVWR
jgi:2-oxoglutarate ferredoxin oxidoreductase subunit delta